MTHADDPNKPKVTSPGVGDAPGADSDVFSSALDEALAALASPSEKGSRAAGDDDWLRVDDPAPPVTVTQTKPPKTAQPPAGAVAVACGRGSGELWAVLSRTACAGASARPLAELRFHDR